MIHVNLIYAKYLFFRYQQYFRRCNYPTSNQTGLVQDMYLISTQLSVLQMVQPDNTLQRVKIHT